MQQPLGRCDQLPGLGDHDPGDPVAFDLNRRDADGQGRAGLIGDQGGQAREVPVGGVEAGDRPVILDPEVKLATLGIRQADHVGDEVAITEPAAVALELDHQALAFGNVAGHQTNPFSRNGFGQAVK